MNVYESISAVQGELAKVGISKDRKNTQGSGYNFRGIDDVYNALSPLLSKAGLCVLPRILTRESVERVSKQGGALFYITVSAEFDLCAADGSHHTVRTFGEAMDSGDKATNKAMSAAFKYAMFQTFCIPTEADPDSDDRSYEVATPAALPYYPDESFEKNKTAWRDLVSAGKRTAQQIIANVRLKAELTTDQLDEIESWK